MTTSDSTLKKPARDIRTFCYRCMTEYLDAGYKLTKLDKPKSSCDKCYKQGCQYELHN